MWWPPVDTTTWSRAAGCTRGSIGEAGSGPAVVLCHGFPELAYSWRHQLPALAEAGFRAIAPDQRGYGASDKPEAIRDTVSKSYTKAVESGGGCCSGEVVPKGVAAQLADCLRAVICQRLVYHPDHQLQLPECEILRTSAGVRNNIRKQEWFRLPTVMETGGEEGQWTRERYRTWLASLTAPAIVEIGGLNNFIVPLMSAHLFCFYFGILADDTPPVGLAAYAAAAIAKSPPVLLCDDGHDNDGDGLSDLDESLFQSDPLATDTDGDTLADGDETPSRVVTHSGDPGIFVDPLQQVAAEEADDRPVGRGAQAFGPGL